MFLQGLCRISRDCLSHRGGHYGQYFKNQMQRKIAARLVELPLAQTATCSHLLRQPLAATCSHLQPLAAICSGGHLQPPAATCSHLQPLAATCQSSHLADTCSHLQPLGRHLTKQPLGSPLQPAHLQPLAATWQPRAQAATWQPLGSHLQPLADTCPKWLQQVAARWPLFWKSNCAPLAPTTQTYQH